MFPPYPTSTEGGRKLSPECTRKKIAHRVGTVDYSSTLKTRSDHRDCSKNYTPSLRWRTKHSARLTLILTILLLVGVMAVLVMRATTLPDVSSAVHATGEGGSSSSVSGISQLPNTGGP